MSRGTDDPRRDVAMRDLTSKRWIVAKGVLFLGLAAMSARIWRRRNEEPR
jgi:hypothetical protein